MSIRDQALQLMQEATGSRNAVVFPRVFLEIVDGDHKAAIVLNQILYWTDRTTNQDGWFYKTYKEWKAELGMSAYQIRRVIWGDSRVQQPRKNLQDVGVEVKLKRAPSGSPTVHYRLNTAQFFAILVDYLEQNYHFQVGDGQKEVPMDQPQAPEPVVDSVVNSGIATMSTIECQHCVSSSISTETPTNITVSIDDTTISETPVNEMPCWFESYERWFGKLTEVAEARLTDQENRLGHEKLNEVIQRCLERGRSWAYVLKALENEPPQVSQNRLTSKWSQYTDYFVTHDQDLTQAILPELTVTPPLSVSESVGTPWACELSGANNNTVQDAWDMAINQLELQLDRASFDTYLRKAILVDYDPTKKLFVLAVHSIHARDMLQYRLYRNVQRVLSDVYGEPVKLLFETMSERMAPAYAQ